MMAQAGDPRRLPGAGPLTPAAFSEMQTGTGRRIGDSTGGTGKSGFRNR
jgi:hypothetical protein